MYLPTKQEVENGTAGWYVIGTGVVVVFFTGIAGLIKLGQFISEHI